MPAGRPPSLPHRQADAAGSARCCAGSCWSISSRSPCSRRRCSTWTNTRMGCWKPKCRPCANRRASMPARWAKVAVRVTDPNNPVLVPDLARPLLRPPHRSHAGCAGAKLYAPDGALIADSRVRDRRRRRGQRRAAARRHRSRRLHAAWSAASTTASWPCCRTQRARTVDISPDGAGADWQPDVREEIRLTSSTDSHEMHPYIRRTQDGRLLVTRRRTGGARPPHMSASCC